VTILLRKLNFNLKWKCLFNGGCEKKVIRLQKVNKNDWDLYKERWII